VSRRSSRTAVLEAIARVPFIGDALSAAARGLRRVAFPGSSRYWEDRYRSGRSSGPGSEGELAAFKAGVLNDFVRTHKIASVVELGCGDGSQLGMAEYPRYVGLDVSVSALQRCIERFAADPTKSFFLYNPLAFSDPGGILAADLSLSIDVIYHLVEDQVYDLSMRHLFAAGRRYVIVYSSNVDALGRSPHVRHRHFTTWVERNAPGWALVETVPNPHPQTHGADGSPSDFYVFGRHDPGAAVTS
jgi:hypothetical protein